jgi:hypothetical protein
MTRTLQRNCLVIEDVNFQNLIEALRLAQEHEDKVGQHQPEQHCRVYHQNGVIKEIHVGPPWADLELPWIEQPADMLLKIDLSRQRVINDRLITLDFRPRKVVHLVKSPHGPYRTVRGFATLLLETDDEWKEIDRYQDRID